METRSHSSSPDPLAYPGDPDFLLSSATKPFSQRRMSMTPFKSRTPRTPWSAKNKDKSAKGAKLIKYPEIILPSTPSGDRFNRKSLSPTKTTLHSESNISPWRIRVTVEAERDEDEENNNAIKNVVGDWMNGDALRVPLRSEESSTGQTPKKPRGRPRKSDVSKRVPTPGRKKSASIFGSALDSTKKRKRGRPRKTLEPPEQNSPSPQRSPAKSIGDPLSGDDPFLDIAQGDIGHFGDVTEAYDSQYPPAQPIGVSTSQNNDIPPEKNTPDNVGIASNLGEKHDGPESFPFAQEDGGISPINVSFAGRTPRPKFRLYPTPTSSSQLDDEPTESANIHPTSSKTEVPEAKRRRITDPTEEHREFDSIMESEGFSMVSLTSLPSARQKLLSSLQGGSTKSMTVKNTFQNLLDGKDTGKSESVERIITASQETRQGTRLRPVLATSDELQIDGGKMGKPLLQPQTSEHKAKLADAVPAFESEQGSQRRPLVRLARIIRVGISFQRLLNRNWELLHAKGLAQSSSPVKNDDSYTARQRTDELFGSFNLQTRKELSAGLHFGEVLAQRTRKFYKRQPFDNTPMGDNISVSDHGDVGYPVLDIAADDVQSVSTAPLHDEPPISQPEIIASRDNYQPEEIDSEMARREAEWQREREAISRQIAEANASQVIVIDSVDDDEGDEGDMQDMQSTQEVQDVDDVDDAQSFNDGHEEVPMDLANRTVAEDDDYEDIWQQEARENALHSDSPSFADATHDDTVHPRRNIVVAERDTDYDQDEELLELSWSTRKKDPMRSLGRSHLAKYRDKDFEFRSLIGTPESSTKRFIQGGAGSGATSDAKHLDIIQENSGVQRIPTSPVMKVDVIPDAQRYTRAPSAFNESISDIPPPPSLKYTGSDLITTEQEEHPPIDHAPQPLGFVNESHWDQMSPEVTYQKEHVENHIMSKDALRNELEMEHNNQVSVDKQQDHSAPTSWFHRLTSLAPKWFTASHSTQEARAPDQSPAEPVQNSLQTNPSQPAVQANPIQTYQPAPKQLRFQPQPQPQPQSQPQPQPQHRSKKPKNKALALSGYFTDDHYYALRNIYHQAKERPDLFPYIATPERDAMLGMWMYSTDGHHHRKVTEIQLAIVDKFRRDLVEAARRRGSADQLGWSEEDILWRLFSIIVGETIRAERKRQFAMESNPEEYGYGEEPPYMGAV